MSHIIDLDGLRFDGSAPIDLCRPVQFDGLTTRAFGLPPAREKPFEFGDVVLDVARGGSVNCMVLEMAPHGNGTHTEGVAHLVEGAPPAYVCSPAGPILAQVVSVPPSEAPEEAYAGNSLPDDRVIAARDLPELNPLADAIVVVTGHAADDFSGTNPPYFTDEAMHKIRAAGIDHLITDVPSVDREDDGGALSAHRVFFDIDPDDKHWDQVDDRVAQRTITELARVPDAVHDGLYALVLHVSPLMTDAVPSRPILFARFDKNKVRA